MTSGSSKTLDSGQEQFDIAPLSWVMTELREALSSAGKLLHDAISQEADAQSTSLLQAKTYLHQAHGALQIVEVEGVSIVTETVEELIERIQAGKLAISKDTVQKMTEAFYAVLRYLEDLLAGNSQQPVRLFPEYRALLELKGAERIHPADLFFPSLSIQEKIPELAVSGHPTDINYGAIRLRFEKLLLTVLTSKNPEAKLDASNQMSILIREIEQAQVTSQTKAFWLVMRAFAESTALIDARDERHIKQIWGRINLQIRRLVEGNASVPERLLRDALFFIAQVREPSPFVAQIRKAYQLEDHVPADYDQKRYGLIAPNVLSNAKELLTNIKNLWGRISNGDSSLADKFFQKMNDLAELGASLQSSPLTKLLRELNGIASHAVRAQDKERMGLELATCLLFLENALEQITHLPANFSARADEISARLLSVVSGEIPDGHVTWIGEISREAQQRQTMGVLVNEMQHSLKQAEKALDEHFRDVSNTAILAPVDGVLAQLGGALAILDQDDALAAVNHTRQLISSFSDSSNFSTTEELGQLHQKVARNIGALSFFIETLQSQPELAKKRFNFEVDTGIFQTSLLEKTPEKELLPSIPLEVNTVEQAGTAEQDLIEQQKESERLLASLVDAPQDSDLQAQLKDSFDHERSFAALLDDSEASARAKNAIDLLAHADLTQTAALDEIVAATSHVEVAQEIPLSQELPETEAEIDAELLEIFLTEADEVLGAVQENIPLSRHDTANQEYLIRLRRSFHTLKGSGRMVGLMVFGEGAWNIEQVMNQWLSESRSGTESLYQLLEYASEQMFAWVEELKLKGSSSRNSDAIIAAALRVKAGEEFSIDSVSYVESQEQIQFVVSELNEIPTLNSAEVLIPALNDVPVAELELDSLVVQFENKPIGDDDAIGTIDAQPDAETASTVEYSAVVDRTDLPFADEDIDSTERELVSELICSADVSNVREAEAELEIEQIQVAAVDDEFLSDNVVDVNGEIAVSEASTAVDNIEVAEEMHEIVDESEFDKTEAQSLGVPKQTAQIIEFPDFSMPASKELDNTKRIGEIEISLPLHTIYMAETDEIVRFLAQDFSEWRHEPNRPVSRHAVHAAHSLAGSSATVGLFPAQELAHSLENVLQRLERHPVSLTISEFDLLDHTIDCVKTMLQKFALSEMADRVSHENLLLSQLLDAVIARSNVGDDGEFITSTNERLDHVMLDSELERPQIDSDLIVDQIDSFAVDIVENEVEVLELLVETGQTELTDVVDEIDDADSLDASILQTLTIPDEALADIQIDDKLPDGDELVLSASDTLPASQDPISDLGTLDLSNDSAEALGGDSLEIEATSVSDVQNQIEESAADGASVKPDHESTFASAEIDVVVPQAALPTTLLSEPAEIIDELLINDVIDDAVTVSPQEVVVDRSSSEIELKVTDELDHDLLPVFLEEGNDLLPMIGQLLRSWQQSPQDDAIPQSILRLMHTVKGSARMAGAMQLGQHTHDMETRIENLMHTGSTIRQPLLEDLLSRHDYAMHLFERLQNPDVAMQLAPLANLSELSATEEMNQYQEMAVRSLDTEELLSTSVIENDAADAADGDSDSSNASLDLSSQAANEVSVSSAQSMVPSQDLANVQMPVVRPAIVARALRQVAPQVVTQAASAPVPLVRVRADILDRLVNQAGEVSISRSKLENEVDTLKASLSELTENVSRLRDQLREVEIQAETQITSRMAFSGDREFDPLEFDRFTRLQELTRMMAESVSDVATVQTALSRTIDGATNDLHTQARLTRELQQDLMRVRMIPFSSVSERLYRIARQTAKEMDKRVNLDIRGTSVEIDRSVLEKMVGPFEHMLRNAIVHGIESRQDRVVRGKNEVGELLIEIRQEGNEVVIHFTDDGQGLNIHRIREKAKNVGLLTDESFINESDVVNLIFEPGFSTANEVTELAGRGVGMDVVRSEAASLGGRVSVSTVEGKGAHFTIHLPLTLAVTQVVILNAGGKTFAVPSVLVEQVQQLKSAALATAYNDGAIMWQGSRVPLHYLPSMLGERDATPDTQQYTPILIMKSDNERVAIHVDQIIGNREVVVKNVGPQLARMIGIAGATVLGSGNIVLILNPVPLAQKIEYERAKLPDVSSESSTHEMGAVAEMVAKDTAPVKVEPVQGLRSHHIVMVVDDSLTVRRVTQRLLVREGYQVVLAKDGIDALEQLQSITPDVMLVDIEMPRMDGFDLTRNVRSDSRTNHIPIIMITSRTADKHRNYAAELGVNEYFGKPYREDDLLTAISGFVNRQPEMIS